MQLPKNLDPAIRDIFLTMRRDMHKATQRVRQAHEDEISIYRSTLESIAAYCRDVQTDFDPGSGRQFVHRHGWSYDGLYFRDLTTRSLKDIVAASSESTVFNFLNSTAPFALMNASGFAAES